MEYLREVEKNFFETIGLPYPYERPKQRLSKRINKEKIFVLADIHEPFALDQQIRNAVMKHNDSSRCVVVGDLGDFYSKSRFPKRKAGDFYEELREIFYRLEFLSTHFTEVDILLGNHDNRPQKKFMNLLSEDSDLMILTENDLIKRLASYFPNVFVVGIKLYGTEVIEVTHFWQLGDIVFCHGELSRKQSSAILERISDYLKLWKKELNLKPYRVIVQGHNHRAAKIISGEELRILAPCSMDTKSKGGEYVYSSRLIGEPPSKGYVLLYQKNGKTDFNKSNFYLYGE